MYSVLIVDDEDPVLESYSYMVRNSDLDLDVCGAARSGYEALSLAHATHPDIVVMDIAMPGIDGLDTIKELQKTHPETLYILSTAYERFDLAQRAIPLRVFEYLIKPVSRRRFLDTLKHAREVLDARRDELSHRLEEVQTASDALAREQRDFLLLITWKGLDVDQWERYRRLFQLTSDYGRVAVVRFDSLPATISSSDAITQIVQRLERRFRILTTEYLGRLLIFVMDTEDADTLDRYIRETIATVLSRSAKVSVGIGGRRTFTEFYQSYEDALAGSRTGSAAAEADDDRDSFFTDLRGRVSRARTTDELYRHCTVFFDREFDQLGFPAARARMIALFTLLLEDLAERTDRTRAELVVERLGDPASTISALETRSEWDAWAGRALRLIVENGTDVSGQRLPTPLRKAITYIETHYGNTIPLAQLADHCEISTGYLCRLFSEHLDTTFNDYLNTTRIEVAERLIKENRLSIKEIAYATGYRDPNYFSRIFKKIKGLSPTSYSTRKETYVE